MASRQKRSSRGVDASRKKALTSGAPLSSPFAALLGVVCLLLLGAVFFFWPPAAYQARTNSAPPVASAVVPPTPLRGESASTDPTPLGPFGETLRTPVTPYDANEEAALTAVAETAVAAPDLPHWRAPSRISLVIDDIGPDVKAAREAIDLPPFVSLALLPYAEGIRNISIQAWERGHTVLIHMPMEPEDSEGHFPGPGTLTTQMLPQEIGDTLREAIQAVPGAEGLNNHMGSRLTQDSRVMGEVMSVLASKRLFFLDSLTTPRSVGQMVARQKGIQFAARDVFLDNETDPAAIEAQLDKLEKLAVRRGYAVAIGHPHPNTLEVLRRWIPEAEKRGVRFVSLSVLLRENAKKAH